MRNDTARPIGNDTARPLGFVLLFACAVWALSVLWQFQQARSVLTTSDSEASWQGSFDSGDTVASDGDRWPPGYLW